VSVLSEGMIGCSDEEVNSYAHRFERIIITQDQDFGKMIYTTDVIFTGIIYLRPGHLNSNIHIQTLSTILEKNPDLNKSFLMVGENLNGLVKIRIRYPLG
jgi:predicted nuclease of predicted toxin-antitoxin system